LSSHSDEYPAGAGLKVINFWRVMMNKVKPWHRSVLVLVSLYLLTGCAGKAPVNPSGAAIEKTLKDAEKDARSGNEAKAVKEIDAAEQALIKEDKQKPYPIPNKQWSGEDAKAHADSDAIKELNRAKRDAKAKRAGDSADELKKALKDVEIKEGN
jgi:hypothetical protein